MRCTKCGKDNIIKANFCKYCGYKFSQAEQKKAKRKTLVGKLELIEKGYSICKLKFITDNIIFKIASIIMLIAIGICLNLKNGNDVRILKSDMYKIEYNTNNDEYYLLVDEDKINLNLYIPNNLDKIDIKHMNSDGSIILENSYNLNDEIVLDINSINDYYLLDYNDSKIKFFIYKVEK